MESDLKPAAKNMEESEPQTEEKKLEDTPAKPEEKVVQKPEEEPIKNVEEQKLDNKKQEVKKEVQIAVRRSCLKILFRPKTDKPQKADKAKPAQEASARDILYAQTIARISMRDFVSKDLQIIIKGCYLFKAD